MEKQDIFGQILSCSEFDIDNMDLTCYNPTLKVDIGSFPAGTKIDGVITFMPEQGVVGIYDNSGKKLEERPLKLTVL